MGLGFLDNLFCDDNNSIIIILILIGLAVFLLSSNDGCGTGFSFGSFNIGENWLLIVIVLLVVFGDGLDIF